MTFPGIDWLILFALHRHTTCGKSPDSYGEYPRRCISKKYQCLVQKLLTRFAIVSGLAFRNAYGVVNIALTNKAMTIRYPWGGGGGFISGLIFFRRF